MFSLMRLELRLGQKDVEPKVWPNPCWQFQRKVLWGLREVQGICKARYVHLDENVANLGDLAHQSNDGRKLKNKKMDNKIKCELFTPKLRMGTRSNG